MKLSFTLPVLLIVLLNSNLSLKDNSTALKPNTSPPFPIIIDSCFEESGRLVKNWTSTSRYEVFYIGKEKDSIVVNCHETSFLKNYTAPTHHSSIKRNYSFIKSKNLEIRIDTSQKMKTKIGYDSKDFYDDIFEVQKSRKEYFDAFPILLKNTGKDTSIIGFTYPDKIVLIMEAQNEKGKWQAIEELENISNCGFGVFVIFLPPKEIVITSAIKYQGSFKTKMRINFDSTSSTEFYGNINLAQFKNFDSESYIKNITDKD